MNTFYSIIYTKPNSANDEKIAVGLVLVSNGKVWFDFALQKIDIAEKLISGSVKGQLLNSMKGLKTFFSNLPNQLSDTLFIEENFFTQKSYLQYLHQYTNNVLQFSEPMPLAAEGDSALFSKLAEKLIDMKVNEKASGKKSMFHHKVLAVIKKANLQNKVDIDLKLSPKRLKGIYTDTSIRLIGKNGIITAANDIDFTIAPETLANQLSQWEVLIHALNSLSEDKNWKSGSYHLIFNSPEKKSEQEKILNRAKQDKKDIYKLLNVDEIDTLLHTIKENDYQPLSNLL
uniref:DUF3037 domain-containing protein n=1 Tax=Sphingobacterium sp. (strain 21) TaxID=743722 RepID=F4CBJ8_SPHS2